MRAVFALVLLVGMALAGVAVYMAQGYMSQTEAALARATELQRKTGRLVQVYAVKTAMKFGDPLTAEHVQPVYVQEQLVPNGAFLVVQPEQAAAKPAAAPTPANPDEPAKPGPAAGPLFPTDTDKPRFLARSVEPNEILLASRVTEPGEAASLTGKLDKGMRAFQVKIDVASGVSSFIMPEAFIDIYWTGVASGDVSGEVTRLIESAVRVIAVDSASGEGQMATGNARTVTVAVTAEQVARLAQAQATGRLAMSLVASAEDAENGLVEVDRNKLLGVEKQEAAVVEAAQVCTIKTRKGPDVIEVPIPCTN